MGKSHEHAKSDEEHRKQHDPGSWLPVPSKMKKKLYLGELHDLQVELVKAQIWAKDAGERVLLIFEGRDTAGKGGTIKRFRENINPRGAPHIALPKPSDVERSQWYFQRYVEHLPTGGEIVFFDRSWYNRAGVERVMGFCTGEEYARFMREVPIIEEALVDDGIRMFKMYLSVNKAEQKKRLYSRKEDPLKIWKLSPTDMAGLERFDAYTEAQNHMFLLTHTMQAPWTVINSNDKRTARINAIKHVLWHLPYEGKNESVVTAPDSAIIGPPDKMFPTIFGPSGP